MRQTNGSRRAERNRDVIVHYFKVHADRQREMWTVWVEMAKVAEFVSEDEAVDAAIRLASQQGRLAWLCEGGIPVRPIFTDSVRV